jgi:hypothetical protein
MKAKKLFPIFIFSIALVVIIIFYIFNFKHLKISFHFASIFSIFLLAYFLFMNITKTFINLRNGTTLQNGIERMKKEGKPSFLSLIIIIVAILTIVMQLIPITSINNAYANIILLITLIILFFVKLWKHYTSKI